jgi:hypothetical protein
MKALSRYAAIDEYTLGELRLKYEEADTRGRMALLKSLNRRSLLEDHVKIPYEIAALAASDESVEVRQWLALNLRYYSGDVFEFARYTQCVAEADRMPPTERKKYLDAAWSECWTRYPDRDLRLKLENDPEPLVRAALIENYHMNSHDPHWDWGGTKSCYYSATRQAWVSWKHTTHLERLAFVRNPKVPGSFVERLFDPEDTDLSLDLREREELLTALLTNSRRTPDSIIDWWMFWPEKHLSRLWELVLTWPEDTTITYRMHEVLRSIDGDPANDYSGLLKVDEIKALVYRKIKSAYLRQEMLQSCSKFAKKTLTLGLADEDEKCRNTAKTKLSQS